MKRIISTALIMFSLLALSNEVSAQGFLDKVNKGLEKVNQKLDQVLGTDEKKPDNTPAQPNAPAEKNTPTPTNNNTPAPNTNAEKTTPVKVVQEMKTLTPEIMSGRKTQGVYGNVRKITYSDGDFVEFNKDGNITKKREYGSNYIAIYEYVSKKRYLSQGEPYNIIFKDNERTEVWDCPEQLKTYYEFDTKGRLKAFSESNYGWYEKTEYYYNGNDLLPYKSIADYGSPEGVTATTSLYTYTNVDETGNWLNCKVEMTIESEDYDHFVPENNKKTKETKTISLSRSIQYFTEQELAIPQKYVADKKSSFYPDYIPE